MEINVWSRLNPMEFQGYISDRRSPFYVTLMLPIVTIKNAIELIRKFLQKLIWAELIQKNANQESDVLQELVTIAIFIGFCLVCMVSYRFSAYYGVILWLSAVCWYLDLVLSKRNYGCKQTVHLNFSKDDYGLWQSSSNPPRKFHRSNLIGVGICQTKILSNAFGVAIARPWQIFLLLENGTNLILAEEHKLVKALAQSIQLSDFLNLPISFMDAADQEFKDNTLSIDLIKSTPSIKTTKKGQKWHIYTQWAGASSKYFFQKVSNESGFLLFTIILTEFMSRFGSIIDNTVTIYQKTGLIYLNFSHLFASYRLDWFQILWAAIAIGIMIWKGIQISQIKHIYINSEYLSYGVNRKLIAQLEIAKLNYLTVIDYPEPTLLISDGNVAIEITDLLDPQDFANLYLSIKSGLQEFQSKPKFVGNL